MLNALHRFEWIGLTDLFEPSLCLLHYQASELPRESCRAELPRRLIAE